MRLFPIKYGIQIPNWSYDRNNMAAKCGFVDIKINNRVFKWPFVAIANVLLSSVWCYNIDNSRDCKIYNNVQLKVMAKTNNVQKSPICMHREHMGAHSNAPERTGAHGSARECTVKTYNFQQSTLQTPNKPTNKYALTLCCFFCFYYIICAVAEEIFWIKTVPLNF